MRVLLDTNLLLRLSQPDHPHYPGVTAALSELAGSAAHFCISSQTVYEFLAVATRPLSASGLGMAQADADAEIEKLVLGLTMLYDSPSVVKQLRFLVVHYSVTGKSIHDARLVATMQVNGIASLMTINAADFRRYSGIALIDPRAAIGS